MKQREYIVTCPICGRTLFKSSYEVGCKIEVKCSKCGSTINVKVDNYTLSVMDSTLDGKEA